MTGLLVVSNKRYHTDFRKYLMRAAERAGAGSLHIYCWERVILSRNGSEFADFPTNVDEHEILRHVHAAMPDAPTVVLTGMGGNEASLATRLHYAMPDAISVYDVYDDLLYSAQGLKRAERLIQDAIWRARTKHAIILDDALKPRYPRAHHLDNASHLTRLRGVETADHRALVYIGSIDDRVDFAWLDAVASLPVTLAIHGRIHPGSSGIDAALHDFLARHANAAYHGEYDNDDLWSILGRYRFGLLPYKVNHPMTEHVNPDKLYHYLNAGLDVLAAPIPQARRYADHVHLINADGDFAATLAAAAASPRARNWSVADHSWGRRWTQLLQAVGADG